jgi:outer membrane protein TolC
MSTLSKPKKSAFAPLSLIVRGGLGYGVLALALATAFAQATYPATPAANSEGHDYPFARLKELSVDVLVEQVLARNPSLAQMEAAWQAASARYPQVTSLDDPMVGAALAPASIGSNEVEFGGRLEISQKYPFPGKRALRGQAALAEAGAAERDVEDMRLQLIESAKNAFFDYYLVHRALGVNDEGVRLLREARNSAEARVRTSKASLQEVLQIDVEIGRQQERRINLERIRKVATARINTLLHLAPDQALPPPPGELPLAEAALPPLEVLRSRALALRPDLQALANRLAAEQAALALACRERYPDFEGFAAYDSIMGNGPTRDLAPQIGFRINLPVRKERRYAAVAEAQAKVAQRRAELASRTDLVNFQVHEAYEQVHESESVVRLYQRSILPAAGDNIKAARPAYVTAQIPLLGYLEAQRTFVSLQDRYYEAVADYFRRRATLERVSGGPLSAPP